MFFSRLFHNVLFHNNVLKNEGPFRLMDSPYRFLNQKWMTFWRSYHIVKRWVHEIDCSVKCFIWKITLPDFKRNSFCSVPGIWIESNWSGKGINPKSSCLKVWNWGRWQRRSMNGNWHLSCFCVWYNSTLQMTWLATQCIYVANFPVLFFMKYR